MRIFLSYIFLLFIIAVIGIAYYNGGFWPASTFLLLGIIVLLGLLSFEHLQFVTPRPHWVCGTPQAMRDEVNELYPKAVDLVKENKGATLALLEENLDTWGNGGTEERIIKRMVEEGILIETTTRTWVLKE